MTPPLIKNVFYMLSYAFRTLRSQGYKNVATESFSNTAELFAAILEIGIAGLVKRGLGRDYINRTDAIFSPRGKIETSESIKSLSFLNSRLICGYDEFSVNSYGNRVLKSSLETLLRTNISKDRKKKLQNLTLYFSEIDSLDLRGVDWRFRYHQNKQNDRMLLSICFLLAKGLLQTQTDGTTRLTDYLDEQETSKLYEKFLLAFFKKECPYVAADAPKIPWALDDGFNDMLPEMRSDVALTRGDQTLIIDAKYYSRTTNAYYDVRKLKTANLYQIFAYVKNMDKIKNPQTSRAKHEVSGMLLYAKTDEETTPDVEYRMSGNKIAAKTIDLNSDFSAISDRLKSIVKTHFGIK